VHFDKSQMKIMTLKMWKSIISADNTVERPAFKRERTHVGRNERHT
jgi:hypothetical protein